MKKQLERILELQALVMIRPHLKDAYLAYIEDFNNKYGMTLDEAKRAILS